MIHKYIMFLDVYIQVHSLGCVRAKDLLGGVVYDAALRNLRCSYQLRAAGISKHRNGDIQALACGYITKLNIQKNMWSLLNLLVSFNHKGSDRNWIKECELNYQSVSISQ